jgi:hypothetical protein
LKIAEILQKYLLVKLKWPFKKYIHASIQANLYAIEENLHDIEDV